MRGLLLWEGCFCKRVAFVRGLLLWEALLAAMLFCSDMPASHSLFQSIP